jgi:rubrerythrin
MEGNCCEIVKELAINYKDEIDANTEYTILARQLKDTGTDYYQIVEKIAEDEFKHLVLLHGIVSILNESCGCEVADGR